VDRLAGWLLVTGLAVLPWASLWSEAGTVTLAAVVMLLYRPGRRSLASVPWPVTVVVASSAACAAVATGWASAGGWILLAAAVVGVGALLPGSWAGAVTAADAVAIVGWGGAFVLRPQLLEPGPVGWLAPGVGLVAARLLVRGLRRRAVTGADRTLSPPDRSVRGTLSVRSAVVPGADGLPRSVPLDLEVRAGSSVAILCEDPADGHALSGVLAGRRPPLAGEVVVDGVPLVPGDRVVAVVGLGEPFIPGDLEENLAAFLDEPIDDGALAAVRETCGLHEVAAALGRHDLAPDGSPLTAYHRLLLQVARVLPSPYRVVVVVDPSPWVSPDRSDAWRAAVVRAAVGRTAVWITEDRQLARRADSTLQYRSGALRAVRPD
jgi:hypothetical protein